MSAHRITSPEHSHLQVSKLTDIANLAVKFSGAVGAAHLLSLVVKQALDLMDAEACTVWLKDESGNFTARMSYGLKTKLIRTISVHRSSKLARCVAKKKYPVKICGLVRKMTPAMRRLIVRERIRSVLLAPLLLDGEYLGVIMVANRSRRAFTATDTKVFNAIAMQAALAIADIGLYDRMGRAVREKMREMSTLFTMSRSISSSIDLATILDIILEKARMLMRAKFCTLKLTERSPMKLRLAASAGLKKQEVRALSRFDEKVSQNVMKARTPLVINDIHSYLKRPLPSTLRRHAVSSLLLVPLFSHKRKIGTLAAYMPEVRIFEKEDIEMFDMVGSLCSMAIENTRMLEQVRRDYLNAIKTLAKVIDANDSYTRGHCDKVMRYSLAICRKLKLPRRYASMVKTASLLHDIGKIGIELGILRKKEKLSEEDWRSIRMHPEIGAKIVRQVGFLNEVVPIIKHHHSQYAGGGYPDPSLKGERIPIGARVIAVADAYDAMTSDRPYRRAMTKAEAMGELRRCSGTQFDPKVVDAFLAAHR